MAMPQNEPPNEEGMLCCRACLATDGRLYNIHENKLSDAFAGITGTCVARDKLPQHLCAYCGMQLLKSASFRDMCLRTQQSLTTELLKDKLNLSGIRKINHPPNRHNLTLSEIQNVECVHELTDAQIESVDVQPVQNVESNTDDTDLPLKNSADNIKIEPIEIFIESLSSVKEEINSELEDQTTNIPNVKMVEIDVIKKADSKIKHEDQKDLNKDKVTCVKRKIGNALKRRMESEDNDEDIRTEIKMEDSKSNNHKVTRVSAKKKPVKRKQETKKIVVPKKKKIGTKIGKSESAGATKKFKRKFRSPENENMPEFDFAKIESAFEVKIVTLSKEEQLEEIALRKKSRNYTEARFKCEDCGKGYMAEAAFSNHRARHSPSEGEFPCEICSMRFRRNYAVQKHQDCHRLKLTCNKCNFVSRSREQAKKHHGMHAGKTYECQHCGKSFNKPSSYFNHVRMSHPTLNVSCDLCGDTFIGDHGLRMHKKRMHAENMTSQKHKCTTCSAEFNSVEALNRHLETAGEHSDLRPCEQCGENCASEHALHEHGKEKHSTETYRCNECDMCFRNSAAHETHTRRKHRGQRARPSRDAREQYRQYAHRYKRQGTFVCEQCGRIMKNVTLFRYHLLQHQNVKMFACNECPKTFVMKGALQLHKRSHTGEKPYKCPDCPLAFSLKGNFDRHHKTAHLGIRDNIPCDICGRVYSAKRALTLHMDTVHHGKPGPKRDRNKAKRKRTDTLDNF